MNYKKLLSFVLLWCLVPMVSSTLAKTKSGTGIGVIIGEPTGITAKMWTSERTAFDAAAAWSFYPESDFIHLHLDYLLHYFPQVDRGTMMVYWGAGPIARFKESAGTIGLRVPFGIGYLWDEAPVEIFLEIAPRVELLPASDFNGNAAIGVRYYL